MDMTLAVEKVERLFSFRLTHTVNNPDGSFQYFPHTRLCGDKRVKIYSPFNNSQKRAEDVKDFVRYTLLTLLLPAYSHSLIDLLYAELRRKEGNFLSAGTISFLPLCHTTATNPPAHEVLDYCVEVCLMYDGKSPVNLNCREVVEALGT